MSRFASIYDGIAERQKPVPSWRGYLPGTSYQQEMDDWARTFNRNPATGAPAGTTPTAAEGNLAGAPPFSYSGAYGGIPQVPSPGVTQGAAVAGNVGNLGALKDLATQVNQFNTGQAVAPYLANLPGYQGMVEQASKNIGSNLAGQVPADVWNLIQQKGAERGAAIGSPGSPNMNTAMLKALGLTSLDLMNQGNQQLSQAIARTPVGPQFNPAAMFVTPEQWQAAQMAANLYNAAPVPALKAQADLAAVRAGAGAGRAATAPSYVISAPKAATPALPQLPSSYSAPTPAATSQNYLPSPSGWGETSSSLSQAIDSAYSPYNLGGYSFGDSSFLWGEFGETSSRTAETIDSVLSPYNLGGYSFGDSSLLNQTGDLPPSDNASLDEIYDWLFS